MTLSELSYAQIERALQALPEPLPHHSRSSSSSSGGSSGFLAAGSSHGGYHGYAAWQGGYQEHDAEVKQEKPAVLSALLQQSLLTLAMQPQRRAMAEQDQQANPAHSPRSSDLDLHDDDYSEPSSPHFGQEQEQQQQPQPQQHLHFQQQHVQQQPLQPQPQQQRELQWPEVACPMPLPTPSYQYSSKKRSLSSATHSSHSSFEGVGELPGGLLPFAGQQPQSVKQARAYSDDAATSRSVSGAGGRRVCTFASCSSLARGNGLCKRHGGGKRCLALVCRNSARSGSDYCTSHGGGRRCTVEGCKKGAEGSSFLCVTHGGGKRCNFEGCVKKDQGRGFCKGHGGGRRCQAAGCDKTVKTGSELCGAHSGTYNLLGALSQRAAN
jgi:hypothetical protein